MKAVSPLRYPGGKAAMASILSQIRQLNELGDRSIAEPFAGGAGASLALLLLEETPVVFINDADVAVYDFWWSLLRRSREFLELLSGATIDIAEWQRQRAIYRDPGRVRRLDRGFATFYLNRCNRSGIIVNGGPIGGVRQTGIWKLDARFNKLELRQRCEKISEFRDRIHLSKVDGIEFLNSLDAATTFFFIDPPYFEKSKTLYLNILDEGYHASLAAHLSRNQDAAWILTYDDCPEVRELYRGWATIRPFSLRYAAAERRNGSEILIAPRWMRLPSNQESEAICW